MVDYDPKDSKSIEIQAIRHKLMYMEDYSRQLDTILSSAGKKYLLDQEPLAIKKQLIKQKISSKNNKPNGKSV